MNCLMDNDVILKLAAVRLLDDWTKLAVGESEDVRVLATAKFYFHRKRDLPHRYGVEAVQAAVAFAERCATISKAGNPDGFALLAEVPGIDVGEAMLFSASVTLPDYLVISGDKAGMKALQTATECEAIRSQLKGRVIAFEQVVLALMQPENFAAICEKVIAGEKADKVLQVAFGLGLETTIEKAIEALEHYIAGLRRDTGDLLITSEELQRLLSS